MRDRIREIAESIAKLDDERQTIAEGLREKGIEVLPDGLERGMVLPVPTSPLTASVAAVDGGLLAQEFHGFDLLMSRAVGVVFGYDSSRRTSHKYHPSALPESEIAATYTMDTHEFNTYKSLFRLRREIGCAVELCEKHSPNYLFLDGSIVPQVSDRPTEGTDARKLYEEVLALYNKLFSSCEARGTKLIGVIKDSRGRRFIEILEKMLVESERETLRRSNDTSFLSFLLKEGERTCSFSYATSAKEHVVLKDLRDWGPKISALYCRPAPEDRPLRVEFLSPTPASEVASVICELSKINKRYAYPAVLIEADLRAAMDPLELERAYKDLFVRTGLRSAMMKLRRDSRPFR